MQALPPLSLFHGIRFIGFSVPREGLPSGSSLCSSAASAVATINVIFDRPLSTLDLVNASLELESKVFGHHADNIAPPIMGGFVLIKRYELFGGVGKDNVVR